MPGNSPFLTQSNRSNSHLAWCQSEPQINEWTFLYILLSGLVFEVINLDICTMLWSEEKGHIFIFIKEELERL